MTEADGSQAIEVSLRDVNGHEVLLGEEGGLDWKVAPRELTNMIGQFNVPLNFILNKLELSQQIKMPQMNAQ